MRAVFSAELPPVEPTKPTTPQTAGSFLTMSASWFCEIGHGVEGDVLARLGLAEDEAGVLLGEEALGDDDVEVAGDDDQRDASTAGSANWWRNTQLQAAVVEAHHGLEDVLAHLVEPAALVVAVALEELRAHHRRQRQRDEGRHDDRDRDRDGELAEQPADDAAHEEQRDEHGDQREGDRDDGEADLARALQRRVERLLALLDVAHDVLDHHDRVVDHEADGDGEAHQRQVVDAVAAART